MFNNKIKIMIPENNRINHITISAQVLSYYISGMKADHWFKNILLKFTNNFIVKLREVEWKYFDKMFEKETEAATVVYDTYDTFIKTVASVPIWEMQNITNVLLAYQKDQKSIEGICKKVLR